MHRTKRTWLIIVSALLILILAFSALAEGALSAIYNAGVDLLFDTGNVTLTGHADFTYDGYHFKTFDGKYIQDSVNSLLDVKMTTPQTNGDINTSGYTVVANNNRAYDMNRDTPGKYMSVGITPSSTILNQDSISNVLTDLCSNMLNLLGGPLGSDIAIAQTENGTSYTMHYADGEVPDTLNYAAALILDRIIYEYFSTYRGRSFPFLITKNYNGLIATLYETAYQQPMPENFFDKLYDENGQRTALGDQFERLQLQADMYINQVTAQTDKSVVIIHPDMTFETFDTFNDYLLSLNQQTLCFEDYGPTLSAFRAQHDPNGDDTSMRAYYSDILTQNNCAGMLIEADGDYILCYEDDDLARLLPYTQTVAQRIRTQMEEISLGETDVTITLDDQGRISSVKGKILLHILDFVGRNHELTVDFDCTAGEYDTSKVEAFDPKNFGINPGGPNG